MLLGSSCMHKHAPQSWGEVLLTWPDQEKNPQRLWDFLKAFRGPVKDHCWWVTSTYFRMQGCRGCLHSLSEPLGAQPENQRTFSGDGILLNKGGVWLLVHRSTSRAAQRQVYPSVSSEASWFRLRHWLRRRVVYTAWFHLASVSGTWLVSFPKPSRSLYFPQFWELHAYLKGSPCSQILNRTAEEFYPGVFTERLKPLVHYQAHYRPFRLKYYLVQGGSYCWNPLAVVSP